MVNDILISKSDMHVTFAFVYYFLIVTVVLTLLLALFAIKSVRKVFFEFASSKKLFENQFIVYAKYLAFAVILIILADSVMTYLNVR